MPSGLPGFPGPPSPPAMHSVPQMRGLGVTMSLIIKLALLCVGIIKGVSRYIYVEKGHSLTKGKTSNPI